MTLSIHKLVWNYRAIAVVFTVMLVSGCVGLDAFPIAARAGDTITLALGSPEGMNRSDTTVTFEDSQGGVHDLTANVRGIFKLLPDKASKAWDASSTSTLVSSAKHEPWLVVMALDLPASLPVGAGTIRITTSADYPSVSAHINDVPIRLEILPGVGMPNPLEYVFGTLPTSTAFGDVQALESRPSVSVQTDGSTSSLFGAIEIKLNVETDKGANLTSSNVRVVTEDLTVVTGSRRNWFWDVYNGQEYTILMLSPVGLLADYEVRFKLVFKQANVIGAPTITSIRYYDADGAEVSGPGINQYAITVDSG